MANFFTLDSRACGLYIGTSLPDPVRIPNLHVFLQSRAESPKTIHPLNLIYINNAPENYLANNKIKNKDYVMDQQRLPYDLLKTTDL